MTLNRMVILVTRGNGPAGGKPEDPGGLKSLFTQESLADPSHVAPRQNAGTVHMHPNGRFIYQANRAVVSDSEGRPASAGGENSIAVYAINQDTGEPTRIQNIDTRGGEPRTFSLDASGRILVVANQVPMTVRDGAKTTTLPASLTVFRVRDDGKLDFVRKFDVEAGRSKNL